VFCFKTLGTAYYNYSDNDTFKLQEAHAAMQRVAYAFLCSPVKWPFKVIRVSERQMVSCNNFGFVLEGSEAVVTENTENRAKNGAQNRCDNILSSTWNVESIFSIISGEKYNLRQSM